MPAPAGEAQLFFFADSCGLMYLEGKDRSWMGRL